MEQKSRKPAPKRPATQKQSAPAERTMKQTVIRHLILAASLLVIGLFLVQVLLGIFTRHGRYREVPERVFRSTRLPNLQHAMADCVSR